MKHEEIGRLMLKAAREIVEAEHLVSNANAKLAMAKKNYRILVASLKPNGKTSIDSLQLPGEQDLVVLPPEEKLEEEKPREIKGQDKPSERGFTPGSLADRIITKMLTTPSVANKDLVTELQVQSHSIRGTLSFLKKKGYIQPVSRGVWAITDKGKKAKEESRKE